MLLSIDVGIQNLGLCLMNPNEIVKWKIIDLTQLPTQQLQQQRVVEGSPSTKPKNAKTINFVDISKAIKQHMQIEFPETILSSITTIVIENQIGPIATRMKTIQGMLVQYFVDFHPDCDQLRILFSSSRNKLLLATTMNIALDDIPTGKTSNTYLIRKKQSIGLCKKVLQEDISKERWQSYFEASKKKDDLADCYLQGVYYFKQTQQKRTR